MELLMKRLFFVFSVFPVLSLGAAEDNGNCKPFEKSKLLYTFRIKQLAKQAETARHPDLIKFAEGNIPQEGPVKGQLEQGFSYAVDQGNEIAAWNLARAHFKQETDWQYNLKTVGWIALTGAVTLGGTYIVSKIKASKTNQTQSK